MTSCIRYQGKHSEWFNVLQGTRQGGKSSPILYLLYINDLINAMEQSGCGICLYDTRLSSPSLADDMPLISFSINGLNKMLEIQCM